jgi:hypothetical protein
MGIKRGLNIVIGDKQVNRGGDLDITGRLSASQARGV